MIMKLFTLPIILALTALHISSNYVSTQGTGTTFNKNFGVWFRPDVSKYDADYDSYTVNELVSLVAKIHSKFQILMVKLLRIFNPDYDVFEIPKAVAIFNKHHKPAGEDPLQLILQFTRNDNDDDDDDDDDEDRERNGLGFDQVLQLADEANTLFPNTVQTLILNAISAEEPELIALHRARELINSTAKFQYKLGAKVLSLLCGNREEKMYSELKAVLPLVDIILLDEYIRKTTFEKGLSQVILQHRRSFETCTRRLRRKAPSVEIGFTTGWDKGSSTGGDNCSTQVTFWEGMDSLAVATNTTVIMSGSFDDGGRYGQTGWWRLMESYFYRNASEYVFHAMDEAQRGSRDPISKLTHETSFCHPNFGLYLDPLGSKEDNYSLNELISMISKVYLEFRTILMAPVKQDLIPGNDALEIPIAVAMFNRNHKPPGKAPLQLIVQFELDDEEDTFQGGRLAPTNFQLAKQLAEQANRIYPATVRVLLLKDFVLDLDSLNDTMEQLSVAQREMSKDPPSGIKLGAHLHGADCGKSRTTVKPYLIPLLPLVQYILFSHNPSPATLKQGVDQHVGKITRGMRNCKDKLGLLGYSETEVGLSTSWPDDTPSRRTKNSSILPTYWRGMSDWAMRTRTLVLARGAPEAWRLVVERPYQSGTDYLFQSSSMLHHTLNSTLDFPISEGKETNFSQNFGVWFNPYVSKYDVYYDSYTIDELVGLVAKVHSKFRIMMITLVHRKGDFNPAFDVVEVPRAVATFNKHHKPAGTQPLQLILQFKEESDETSALGFDKLLELADEANAIFPNTVQTLVLDPLLEGVGSVVVALKQFRKLMNSAAHFWYKLGTMMPTVLCRDQKQESLLPQLQAILPLVDVIILNELTQGFTIEMGVSQIIQQHRDSLETCIRKWRGRSPQLEIGYTTHWTKDLRGGSNCSVQLAYWGEMSRLQRATNTTVVMRNAFDREGGGEMSGWWRLVESNYYENASEYVFKSKDDADCEQSSLPTSNDSTPETSFNHPYFGVYFIPFVSKEDKRWLDNYSLSELVSMIAKIYSEFETVLMSPVKVADYRRIPGNDEMEIPMAVAMFNKHHKPPGKQALQLIMQFELDEVSVRGRGGGPTTSFQLAKELADGANGVYPGTVRLLLLEIHEINPDNLNGTVEKLREARKEIDAAAPQVGAMKLGAHVVGAACGFDSRSRTSVRRPSLISLLPFLQYVLMLLNPLPSEIESEVDQVVGELTRAMRNCKYKLGLWGYPETQIGMSTFWPDTLKTKKSPRNPASLPAYWREMSEWAVRTRTLMIFRGAFDIPDDMPALARSGWWRLVEKPYQSGADYVFESKAEPGSMQHHAINSSLGFPTHEEWRGGVNFISHEHFWVFFDPLVSRGDIGNTGRYTTQDLMVMLYVIYSKFRVVVMSTVTPRMKAETGNAIVKIPKAVATFNKDIIPGRPPLQLIMLYELELLPKGGTNQTSFEVVRELAREANEIFPGTVQLLVLRQLETREPISAVMSQLAAARNSAHGDPSEEFQLGVYLMSDGCGSGRAHMDAYLTQVLPQFDLVMFAAFPSNEDLVGGGMPAFARKVTQSATSCKRRLAQYNNIINSTQVAFVTTWPDFIEGSSRSNLSNLLTFWNWMSEWASNSSTTVVVHSAFDVPHAGMQWGSTGLWYLLENGTFQSKETLLLLQQNEIELHMRPISHLPPNPSSFGTQKIVFLVLGSSIFVVALVCSATVFLYKQRQDSRGETRLSKTEIVKFRKGGGNKSLALVSEHPAATTEIEDAPYDQNLELSRESFQIHKHSILGIGAFGVVFKGKVTMGNAEFMVAVKTTNPSSPATALLGLLSEIKVMSYLGKHENIVGIVGAYTKEFSPGKVFVFTELCGLGSLKNYLKEMKESLSHFDLNEPSTSVEASSETSPAEPSHDMTMLNSDLEKWANEICSGMEFLASKRVVHADLATRNVLLTESRTAKISDFGLSRRLNDYEEYVKKKQEPIPWRWMCPESLSQKVFNEKTDVWAFGVTLWELFSLGDVPYSGMSWDVDWVSRLEQGVRLGKPKYDINNRYCTMTKCWLVDPVIRPTFAELKSRLEDDEGVDESSKIEYTEI